MGGAAKSLEKAVSIGADAAKEGVKGAVKDVGSSVGRVVDEGTRVLEREFTIGNDKGALGWVRKNTGVDLKKVNLLAQGKRMFIDKPEAMKAEARAAAAEGERQMNKQREEMAQQKRQSTAEAEASDQLQRRRRTQSRRQGGTGRSSTILTGKLGGAGGQTNQGRKSLLGL